MTSTATRDWQFSISMVLSRTFSTVASNIVVLGILAIVLIALPRALLSWIQLQAAGFSPTGGFPTPDSIQPASLTNSVLGLVFFFVQIALSATAQAAMIYCVVADLSGKKADLGTSLAKGWANWWRIFLINICVGFMTVLAAFLLFVPAIIVAIRWCVSVPAQVMENKGVFGSMGRSADLTKGRRWAIFGLFAVVVLIVIVVEALIAAVILPGGNFLRNLNAPLFVIVAAPLISVITTPLFVAGLASLYFELRSTREGVGVEQLASVFD